MPPLSDSDLIAAHDIPNPGSGLSDADLVKQHGIPQQSTPFSVLPFSEDPQGGVHFDIHAGLTGAALDAFTAPGDAYAGRLDPASPEGQKRAFDFATMFSPMSPAMRAGARAVPGALMSERRGQAPVPTAAELKTAASAGYDAARQTGAEYPGADIGNLAQTAQHELESDGILSELAPQTFAVLGRLSNPPPGSTVNIGSLDAVRKSLGRIAGNFGNPTEQEAARRIIARIDQHIEDAGAGAASISPGPGSTLPVPSAAAGAGGANGTGAAGVAENPLTAAARLIREARANSAAMFRSDRVSGVEEAADLRASAANSGQNTGNTLRQRLASLLLNDKQSRGFSAEELDAMRQVVNGTATSNTLRRVGNMLGGGGGLGQTAIASLGGAIGSAMGGGMEGAAIGAGAATGLGTGTRSAYNSLVGRQMRGLDEMMRRRSPLFQQRPVPMLPNLWDMGAGAGVRGSLLSNPQGLLDAYSFPSP